MIMDATGKISTSLLSALIVHEFMMSSESHVQQSGLKLLRYPTVNSVSIALISSLLLTI